MNLRGRESQTIFDHLLLSLPDLQRNTHCLRAALSVFVASLGSEELCADRAANQPGFIQTLTEVNNSAQRQRPLTRSALHARKKMTRSVGGKDGPGRTDGNGDTTLWSATPSATPAADNPLLHPFILTYSAYIPDIITPPRFPRAEEWARLAPSQITQSISSGREGGKKERWGRNGNECREKREGKEKLKREEDLRRWMEEFCYWCKKSVGDRGGAKGAGR